jgi:hypothetical protein
LRKVHTSGNFLQNSDSLKLNYSTRSPAGQDLDSTDDKVLIATLSSSTQHTIAEFDQLTKSWGDSSCMNALNRLITPQ